MRQEVLGILAAHRIFMSLGEAPIVLPAVNAGSMGKLAQAELPQSPRVNRNLSEISREMEKNYRCGE